MKVTTYEATVENGQIRLSESVRLPEHAKVFVVVPGVGERTVVRAGSPSLARPEMRPISLWTLPRNFQMPAYNDQGFAPAAPVARVVVRHPESGATLADVPMLIDSGADAPLLPKSAVASLGLVGTGEHYGLLAFDGTISEAEAVRAVLVFLNKTFSGRFLQVESEVGVIGRNVLNRVRLLLDGPSLNWEELPPPDKTG